MIARDINLVIPLAPGLLLVPWGRRILRVLFVSSVLFSIFSDLLPRPPLIFSHTRLAFPLLPRGTSTGRAGTRICAFTLAFTIATPAAAITAAPTAAAFQEKSIFSTSEETRSKLELFLPAVLGCRRYGCERYICGRWLGMERNRRNVYGRW